MDLLATFEASLAQLQRVAGWFLADIVTVANLVQIPAVALTGLVASLVARPVRTWLAAFASGADPQSGRGRWTARHHAWINATLLPLVTPSLWAAGLWLALAVAERMAWPYDIARIAANLLLAWLVIRVVADLVPSRPMARLVAAVAWSAAALNILHLLGPVIDILDAAALSIGQVRVSALTVAKGVLSLSLLLWLAMFASRVFEQRIAGVADLTPRAQVLFGKLLKITLVSLAFLVALTSVGIDLSTLALLTGAVGVGVGLGLQKTVSNLFSGILLLLDRSIKPGDVIEVGGTYGWVSSLGARYVAVETRDGMEYLIPNEDIITQQVLNWSHKSERVRLKLDVRAPLDANLDEVLALMKEAAGRAARVLKQPPPNALVVGFGESAVELQLRIWIADAHNGVQNVKSEVLLEIWRLFRSHEIVLPRPQRDVFVHRMEREDGTRPVGEAAPQPVLRDIRGGAGPSR